MNVHFPEINLHGLSKPNELWHRSRVEADTTAAQVQDNQLQERGKSRFYAPRRGIAIAALSIGLVASCSIAVNPIRFFQKSPTEAAVLVKPTIETKQVLEGGFYDLTLGRRTTQSTSGWTAYHPHRNPNITYVPVPGKNNSFQFLEGSSPILYGGDWWDINNFKIVFEHYVSEDGSRGMLLTPGSYNIADSRSFSTRENPAGKVETNIIALEKPGRETLFAEIKEDTEDPSYNPLKPVYRFTLIEPRETIPPSDQFSTEA